MSRAVVILNTLADRQKAANWCMKIKAGTTVTFKENKRSIPQNDYLHALVTEISTALLWDGEKRSVEDWKLRFLDALNREVRIGSSLDGRGVVQLSRSTADLTKEECADMITIIQAYGAAHGVKFGDERNTA